MDVVFIVKYDNCHITLQQQPEVFVRFLLHLSFAKHW